MAEQNDKHKNCSGDAHHHHHINHSDEPLDMDQLDAGSKALAGALQVSFMLLKFIMIVLVLAFIGSGFFTVEQDNQAMVLRLGKITGQGEQRIKQPGWHWCFPAPIDEIVKFPVKQQLTLKMDRDYWYFGDENSRIEEQLKPERDGYCLTRNDKVADLDGNDYNIVHTKWEIKYRIGDIEKFFKSVYMPELEPGQDFYDIKSVSVDPYLSVFAGNAVVNTMVRYSIDDAITVSKSSIAGDVRDLLIAKLEKVDSGIIIDSVLLVGDVKWPRQVNEAFLASTKAAQDAKKEITTARTYHDGIMNETGGQYAVDIVNALHSEKSSSVEQEKLWAKLAGTARKKIVESQTYRTQVVESARANAVYLEKLLPEFKKRPELLIKKIYQDSIERILANADEKIFLPPQNGNKGREIRLLISKDPKKTQNK